MFSVGVPEFLGLVVLSLLIFGSRRFPKAPRSAGETRRAFPATTRIPAGDNPDQIGLPLRQIQLRGSRRAEPSPNREG